MSQDYHHHQGIFSFSNGFHRPSSSHQEEVEESAVSGAPIPVYETAGMLSEMFSYPGGGSGEILDHSTKQLLEQQNRHNNNSTLHMLLPNHHQGYGYANEQQQHHFTWPSSSDHQSQGDMIGTVHVEGGKGLSLSLSSSLEAVAAAKAEEYRSIYCAAVDGTSPSSNASAHHQFNQFKTLLLDNSTSHHQAVGHFGSSSSSPMVASSSIGGIYTLRNSKYTKPAQELLEEFCSVGRGHFKKNKLKMYQQEAKEREEKGVEENQKEDYQQTNNSSNNSDTKPNESNFTLVQTITAQTPTTTMMTPTPHENDSSFLPSSVVTAAPHSVSDSFTAATCQQDVSDHFQVNDSVIRFGTKQAGDVSLTLGLRHTGNMPDNKNPSFSVRDFGDF
ncbi:hypothetical protein F2Q68_00042036 [Brassica cretica]|uniref:POX domain-containing protein n=1 Tax=Brassica cretica TaxID=69181 RepID=A0A8S9MCS5_BRACR|nr:hypothetical protein F2Q68_00042036 [Brassica cretica]